jgi:hypothetical protein
METEKKLLKGKKKKQAEACMAWGGGEGIGGAVLTLFILCSYDIQYCR